MVDPQLVGQCTDYAASKLEEHLAQIERCAALLSDDQVWYRPNESSNSIGNLLLHLRGNVMQWIVAGLDAQPFERDRPAEFTQRKPIPAKTLMDGLRAAVRAATEVIRRLDAAALGRDYRIQNYAVSGTAAVLHVVEHFAFHTGQIITTTKWLLDVDLSLYDEQGHRGDGRNQGTP
ncbi:MAG: DinB family protein [Phycisphaerae bacterium]